MNTTNRYNILDNNLYISLLKFAILTMIYIFGIYFNNIKYINNNNIYIIMIFYIGYIIHYPLIVLIMTVIYPKYLVDNNVINKNLIILLTGIALDIFVGIISSQNGIIRLNNIEIMGFGISIFDVWFILSVAAWHARRRSKVSALLIVGGYAVITAIVQYMPSLYGVLSQG